MIRVRRSRRSLSLLRYVHRLRLGRGAVFEIRITKRRTEGVVRRLTVSRSAKAKVPVKIDDLCLPVGAKRPKRC